MQLQQFFSKNPRIAVAFSGGADSSYLLYAAKAAGCRVRAYFMKSQFQPQSELDGAVRLAGFVGAPLTVGEFDALSCALVAQNPPDRCYHCKKIMLGKITELSAKDGFAVLCDGSNADDLDAERPGMRALGELGVLSPLRGCGLKKADIRRLSKEAGLFTHDKPAYACLATRVPAGTAITSGMLEKIERAETALSGMGFSDFRIRLSPPGGAKIQLPDGQLERAAARRAEILAALQSDFESVLLDLTAR